MLLTRINRSLRKDDEGIALAAAIGVMAVGMLLSALILASVVNGLGFTSATKAGVQSQAAADSGIAIAEAALYSGVYSGSCQYTSAPGTLPEYSVAMYRGVGASWVQGCPNGSTSQVKVISTGAAAAKAVSGQSGNDASRVEAVYVLPNTPSQITATGPAVYAYSSQGFSGSGTLVSVDGQSPNVMVKEGNVSCSGGAAMQGDLVVNNGDLTLSGSCGVTGNVWASGTVALSGGVQVGGSVTSKAITINSGKVGGSVWATNVANLSSATITGSVIAGTLTLSSSKVGGSAWSTVGVFNLGGSSEVAANAIGQGVKLAGSDKIKGSVWSSGDINTVWGGEISGGATGTNVTIAGGNVKGQIWARGTGFIQDWHNIDGSMRAKVRGGNGTASGGITIVPAGPGTGPSAPTPPAASAKPVVPNWVDFKYIKNDWTGFKEVVLTAAQCDWAGFQGAVDIFGGNPGVIDARACASAISISSYQKITMTNDLVIVGKAFNFGGSAGFQSATKHKLWFITPDDTADNVPTCVPGGAFNIGGGFTFTTTIDAMVYTPCQANIGSGIKWRGQVFAGKVIVDGAAALSYVAVGLPNVDLSTGNVQVPTVDLTAWELESRRNIANQ